MHYKILYTEIARAVIGQFEFIITAIKHAAYVMRMLYGGNNARCLRTSLSARNFFNIS